MTSNICYSILFIFLNFFLLQRVILKKTLTSKTYSIIAICSIILLLGIKYLYNDSFFIPKKNLIFLYFFSLIPIILKIFNSMDKRYILKLNSLFGMNLDSNNYIMLQAKAYSILTTIFQLILIWNPEILKNI